MKENRFLDSPIHPSNDHICQPREIDDILAEQRCRKTRSEVKIHGTKPKRAYTQLRASISEEFGANYQQRDAVSIACVCFELFYINLTD